MESSDGREVTKDDSVHTNLTKNSYEFLAEFDGAPSDDLLAKSLVNQASYAGKQLTTKAAVPANIHKGKFREFWLNVLKPDEFVSDTIINCYSLPLRALAHYRTVL